MLISLIHPSRSRVDKAFNAAQKWIDLAGVDVEYILSIDTTDPELEKYKATFSQLQQVTKRKVVIISTNKSAVDAINKGAEISTGRILVVMSDDFDCPQNWGLSIIQQTEGKKDWIAKTPDGIQRWIITLPIMDRIFYEKLGWIYYPEYLHMFCDTELTCVADLTGKKIQLNIPFTHNHYSTGKTAKDEVSIKADSTWAQGESLFIQRARNNFDIVNPAGIITDMQYLSWLKSKGVLVR